MLLYWRYLVETRLCSSAWETCWLMDWPAYWPADNSPLNCWDQEPVASRLVSSWVCFFSAGGLLGEQTLSRNQPNWSQLWPLYGCQIWLVFEEIWTRGQESDLCISCTSIIMSALSQTSRRAQLKLLLGKDIFTYLDYLWIGPSRVGGAKLATSTWGAGLRCPLCRLLLV